MTDSLTPLDKALEPKLFWYLRHGETDWNAQRLSQGRTDIPLNAKGIEQAQAAGKLLAEEFKNGAIPFSVIVTSPLSRASKTAEIVRDAIVASGGPKLDLVEDESFIEVCFGKEEGKNLGNWYEEWISGRVSPEEGESFRELAERAADAVNNLEHRYKGTVMIVAHGALFRAISFVMGLDIHKRILNAQPMKIIPPNGEHSNWEIKYLTH